METTTINHPTSGDTYAVRIDSNGVIIQATGPMHYADSTDPEDLAALIDDQDGADLTADAEWLTAAIANSTEATQ